MPRAGASLSQLQCTQDCKFLLESIGTSIRGREGVIAEAKSRAAADDITQELVYRGKDAGGSNDKVRQEQVAVWGLGGGEVAEWAIGTMCVGLRG